MEATCGAPWEKGGAYLLRILTPYVMIQGDEGPIMVDSSLADGRKRMSWRACGQGDLVVYHFGGTPVMDWSWWLRFLLANLAISVAAYGIYRLFGVKFG